MKLIECTDDLIEFLGCSIPEKKSALASLISGLGVRFLLDENTPNKVFRANSVTKEIRVGQKGMERLWTHAYAYSASFLGTDLKIAKEGVQFEPEVDAILEKASQLLTWSIRSDIGLVKNKDAVVEVSPDGLPSPFDCSDDGTILSFAQSLWCQALCFILFHELSHVQLGHNRQKGEANIQQENDADREAARWFLEDPIGNDRRQLEQRLGVATALIYTVVMDVYLQGYYGEDYPTGYDRLFQTLSQYFYEDETENSQQVWAFVSICLLLHIHNKRIPLDYYRPIGSWRKIANTLVNVLANQKAN